MQDLAKATAAPITRLESLIPGGVKLHPLTAQNWGELDLWLRDDFRRESLAALEGDDMKNLPQKVMKMYIAEVVREAGTIGIATQTGAAKLNTFEGMLKLIQVSARGEFTEEHRQLLLKEDLQTLIEKVGKEIMALSAAPETIEEIANSVGVEKEEGEDSLPLSEDAGAKPSSP